MGKQKYVDCWTYPKPVLDEKLKEINTRVDSAETDISGLETDVSGLGTDVSGLQTDVSGLGTELTNYKTACQSIGAGTNVSFTNEDTFTPPYDCFAQITARSVTSSNANITVTPPEGTYYPCILHGLNGGRLAGMCILLKDKTYTFSCTNTQSEKLYYYPIAPVVPNEPNESNEPNEPNE